MDGHFYKYLSEIIFPPGGRYRSGILNNYLQDILDEAEATVRKRAWNSHFSGGLGQCAAQTSALLISNLTSYFRKTSLEQQLSWRTRQETLEQ